MEDNCRLMTMISTLKMEQRDIRSEFESLSNYVKLLTSRTQSLDNLLSEGKTKRVKNGLGFIGKGSSSGESLTVFVRALDNKDQCGETAESCAKSSQHRAIQRP